MDVAPREDAFRPAEPYFREALSVQPNDIVALVYLARCHKEQKAYDRALADLTAALRYWPASGLLYAERADVEAEQGNTDLALTSLRKAIELEPGSDDLQVRMGRVREDRGEVDEAIQCYRSAIQLNPRSLQGHSRLVVSLYSKGRRLELAGKVQDATPIYEEVARELQTCYSINPNYFPTYMSSGAILSNMGAFAKAETAFRNAVFLQPSNEEARTSLAMVQMRLKKPDEAIKNLRAALQIAPESARAHFLFGVLLSDEGYPEKGLEHLQTAVDLDRKQHGAANPSYLAKLKEVQARVNASSRPITSP